MLIDKLFQTVKQTHDVALLHSDRNDAHARAPSALAKCRCLLRG